MPKCLKCGKPFSYWTLYLTGFSGKVVVCRSCGARHKPNNKMPFAGVLFYAISWLMVCACAYELVRRIIRSEGGILGFSIILLLWIAMIGGVPWRVRLKIAEE